MIIIAFSDKTSKILPRFFCKKFLHVAPILINNDKVCMYQFVSKNNPFLRQLFDYISGARHKGAEYERLEIYISAANAAIRFPQHARNNMCAIYQKCYWNKKLANSDTIWPV